jgi:hypothetical protein
MGLAAIKCGHERVQRGLHRPKKHCENVGNHFPFNSTLNWNPRVGCFFLAFPEASLSVSSFSNFDTKGHCMPSLKRV